MSARAIIDAYCWVVGAILAPAVWSAFALPSIWPLVAWLAVLAPALVADTWDRRRHGR